MKEKKTERIMEEKRGDKTLTTERWEERKKREK